jgi:hypothetical protein
MRTTIHFWSYVGQFFLDMRNVSDKSCRDNKKIVLGDFFFFLENRAVNKIMWKHMVDNIAYAHCMLDT